MQIKQNRRYFDGYFTRMNPREVAYFLIEIPVTKTILLVKKKLLPNKENKANFRSYRQ